MVTRKVGVQKVSKAKGQQSSIPKRVHPGEKQQAKAKTLVSKRQGGSSIQYDEYQRILCVGEGNFSFARALVRNLQGQGQLLTATAYDTKEIAWEKYEVSCVQRLAPTGSGAELLYQASSQLLEFRTAQIL